MDGEVRLRSSCEIKPFESSVLAASSQSEFQPSSLDFIADVDHRIALLSEQQSALFGCFESLNSVFSSAPPAPNMKAKP